MSKRGGKSDDDCSVCDGRVDLDELLRQVQENIRRFGWHAAGVLADSDTPGYTYTVGVMASFNHPELVIFGVAPNVAHGILTSAVDMIRDGNNLRSGEQVAGLIHSFPAAIANVHPQQAERYFNISKRVSGPGIPFLQIVWPDTAGRFPFEPGFDQSMRRAQPLLNEPPRIGGGSETQKQ